MTITAGWTAFKLWARAGGWKWLSAFAVASLAAFFIVRASLDHQRVKTLRAAVAVAQGETRLVTRARTADNIAVAQAVTAKEAIRVQQRITLAKTEAALAANPDWANQPIPADVLASLQP